MKLRMSVKLEILNYWIHVIYLAEAPYESYLSLLS